MLAKEARSSYRDPKNNRVRKVRKKHSKRRKKPSRFKYFILSSIIFLASLGVLSRYAAITDMRNEITDLENEIYELEKEKMNLEASLEGIKSSDEIAKDAMVKLGMHYPKKNQIAYVAVEVDLPKEKTKTENIKVGSKEFIEKAKKIVGGILGE